MKQAQAEPVRLAGADAQAPQGLELRHLRYFAAVADAGTFTLAAEQQTNERGETMTKSVAAAKALKRRPQGLLALAVAGVATIVLAACGPAAAGGSSNQQSPAPTHAPATAPAHSANPIPQGNGGDGDADNNGGPSDGDGNI